MALTPPLYVNGPVSEVRDYVELLKPRVMSLVIFTGLVGLWLAPGTIHPLIALMAVLCISVGAGAAGAINMWYERDIDALMRRTQGRPLPQGKIAPEEALSFGIMLSFLSVATMAVCVNLIAAFWLAFSICFYVFVYTIGLKRHTPHNIVIGGAAGALPPVIGWASVTGDTTLLPWLLFGIIFLWTPPHFWALSLFCSQDYERAGVPMLPNVRGEKVTRTQILAYSWALVVFSLVPSALNLMGPLYFCSASLLGLGFVLLAINLRLRYTQKRARRLFAYSILYLFLLFTCMIVDMYLPL